MLLSLSTQLVVVYASIVALGVVLGGVGTVLLETGHISSTTSAMSDTIKENELANLIVRLDQITATSADLFSQFISNVNYQHLYASDVFNGSLPVVGYYHNYHILDTGDLPADTEDVSFWFQKSYGEGGAYSAFLDKSSLLDNAHGPLFKSATFYVPGLYMGFTDGLYRHYPYLPEAVNYDTNPYTCEYNQQEIIGYDPRCRIWYVIANADKNNIKITQPYIDATTGLVVITISRAVVVADTFYGVVASDISMQYLSNVVLSAKILDSGYTYLCNNLRQLIVHPDVDSDSKTVFYVEDKEFSDKSEKAAFNSFLQNEVFEGTRGQRTFTKDGDTWYVTYEPVNGTEYFLLMVVPEDEILEPATSIETYANSSITILIVFIVIVGVIALVVGTLIANRLAICIAEPVQIFNKILADITDNNFDSGSENGKVASNYREINSLHGKIKNLFMAVKFSTEAYNNQDYAVALKYLDEVETMFDSIQQQRALGIIYNNRGNILRNFLKTTGNFGEALEALRMAVANMRSFVAMANAQLATAREQNDTVAEEAAATALNRLGGVLANRLSNYGDCLREARRFEDSLEALDESYDLFAAGDDISGMINTLGNKVNICGKAQYLYMYI
jgi:hypothetical protein